MKKVLKIFVITFLIIIISNLQAYADLEIDNEVSGITGPNSINAEAAILLENNTGIVIYEKNADEKLYPASTTKIMTAILVLENCQLTDTVTVSANALKSIPDGYVTGGLYEGEQIPVEDLLYELLLKSANDVAVILAEHVSGSTEEFANLMNKKAIEIGCKNTNFVNPNGIHDDNHYTTARDLSLIARYCMNNETFRKIVSTKEYSLPKTNKYNFADRSFTNTNELILKNSKYYYEYATGIKTGYTKEAKSCLIASSKKDNIEYISVVLGSNSTSSGKDSRFTDTIDLFNYGFENYSYIEFKSANEIITNIDVKNATKNTRNLNIKINNPITCFANNNFDFKNLEPTIELNEKISAPISKGEKLGTVTYEIEGIKYTEDLVAMENVEKQTYYFLLIVLGSVILFVGILILIAKKTKNSNHNNRKRVRNKR